jgi:hypothetical protein
MIKDAGLIVEGGNNFFFVPYHMDISRAPFVLNSATKKEDLMCQVLLAVKLFNPTTP